MAKANGEGNVPTNAPDRPGNGSHPKPDRDRHTIEIRLPRESLDLTFQVASRSTDSSCKLIAFLSPKGGSGKTVLGTKSRQSATEQRLQRPPD